MVYLIWVFPIRQSRLDRVEIPSYVLYIVEWSIGVKLFLSRHPETRANREGLILGAGDSPPTDKGLVVFRQAIESIRHEEIDRLMCSPLPRARAGARIAADIFNCTIEIEPGLRELSCGALEGRRRTEFDLQEKPIRRTWVERPPGGESYLDAEKRLAPVVERLRTSIDCNALLIVGHAVVNRVLLKLWLNTGRKEALEFNQGFHEIYVLSSRRLLKKVAVDRKV